MSKHSENKNDKKGFSGLEDFVSDVSKEVEQAVKSSSDNAPKDPPKQGPLYADVETQKRYCPLSPSKSKGRTPTWYVDPDGEVFVYSEFSQKSIPQGVQHNGSGNDPKIPVSILLGGVILLILVLSWVFLGKNQTQLRAPGLSEGPTQTAYSPTPVITIPSPEPSASSKRYVLEEEEPVSKQSSRTPTPSQLTEQKPPIGSGLSLNRNQIAYCLSENIRVEAMKSVLNQNEKHDIDVFNNAVDDYNNRCGNYSYQRGVLESVRGEIESKRNLLENEGRARIN